MGGVERDVHLAFGKQDNVVGGNMSGQQMLPGRTMIWQGILEWHETAKNPADTKNLVPCQVSVESKDDESELKADSWPPKLIIQLIPKQVLATLGNAYLKNSKCVLFHPTPCETLDYLNNIMSTGFASLVHFPLVPSARWCNIKILVLHYRANKGMYFGFIPYDQTEFVGRLRKIIQKEKSTQAHIRQEQARAWADNSIIGSMPTTSLQQQSSPVDGLEMPVSTAAQQREAQYKTHMDAMFLEMIRSEFGGRENVDNPDIVQRDESVDSSQVTGETSQEDIAIPSVSREPTNKRKRSTSTRHEEKHKNLCRKEKIMVFDEQFATMRLQHEEKMAKAQEEFEQKKQAMTLRHLEAMFELEERVAKANAERAELILKKELDA